MNLDPRHRGVITPTDTLHSIPIALEAMGRDLEQLAADLRQERDTSLAISPAGRFILGRAIDRLDTQAQAARGISTRSKECLKSIPAKPGLFAVGDSADILLTLRFLLHIPPKTKDEEVDWETALYSALRIARKAGRCTGILEIDPDELALAWPRPTVDGVMP
jgi:hypothetical protein